MAGNILTFDPHGDLLLRLPYYAEGEEEEGKVTEQKEGKAVTELVADDGQGDSIAGMLTPEEGEDATDESSPRKEICMLVSSKHLMLASPVFQAMLQYSNFKEGDELRKSGRVEVPLPDDDYIAFGIMMDIIHGRVRKIPRKVSLQVLTNLSVLVDKYRTLEVFELILDVWMLELKETLPSTFNEDVLPWISIAWVFRLPDPFRRMTKLLQIQADGLRKEEQALNLPIPRRIFDEIETRRKKAIKDALSHIAQFHYDYSNDLGGFCSLRPRVRVACDGMMLGTFLRSACRANLWPCPKLPYAGLKVSGVTAAIRTLDIMSLCGNITDILSEHSFEHLKSQSKGSPNSHGVKERFDLAMTMIEKRQSGLILQRLSAP